MYGVDSGWWATASSAIEVNPDDLDPEPGIVAVENSLIWLACRAGVRSPPNPDGRFSDREIWAIRRVDADDPVPLRAMYHIARAHDLAPTEAIPSPGGDDWQLPPWLYNEVLETIEAEYGLNPGRAPLSPDDDATTADTGTSRSEETDTRSERAATPDDEDSRTDDTGDEASETPNSASTVGLTDDAPEPF